MNNWSDSRFLQHVETHAAQDRALFTPAQVDKLCTLAGTSQPSRVAEERVNGVRYLVLHKDVAKFLVARARERMPG